MILQIEDKLRKTFKRTNSWPADRCIYFSYKRGWISNAYSEIFAFLIGKIMGDGNLDKLFTCRFISKNQLNLEELKNLIYKELKIPLKKMSIKKKEAWGKSFILTVNDAALGRFLFVLGAPQGRKTENRFGVPNWIKFSKKVKRSFLQGILEDELASFRIKNGFPAIVNFKMAKCVELKEDLLLFLKEIKNLIEEFDVRCGRIIELDLNDSGNFQALFWIQCKSQNIISFSRNIGFKVNKEKIERMNKVVSVAKEIEARKLI